ncbi:type I methionyl aminopeptidase [Candidatus Daviesbacteria bacterium]|nr:type I methionyl aminopeptidase [Candidatus Daviesbacteria bacterium]
MRKSGGISANALKKAVESLKSGITGLELDKIVKDEIYRLGGELSYKTVPGFDWASCITINEQVVHGIPSNRKVEKGDLVSVDLAAMYKGWHTDTAWSVLVEDGDSKKAEFLSIGEEALWLGIKQAVDGKRIGDISNAIQSKVEGAGHKIVRSLVGHGVGRKLHEDPEIPGYGEAGTGELLKEGMTIAIEVIYTMGTSEVVLGEDGWTYSSVDGSPAGLFEMTVIVGKKEAEVLTDWRRV